MAKSQHNKRLPAPCWKATGAQDCICLATSWNKHPLQTLGPQEPRVVLSPYVVRQNLQLWGTAFPMLPSQVVPEVTFFKPVMQERWPHRQATLSSEAQHVATSAAGCKKSALNYLPTPLCKTKAAKAKTCLSDTSAPSSTLGLSHPWRRVWENTNSSDKGWTAASGLWLPWVTNSNERGKKPCFRWPRSYICVAISASTCARSRTPPMLCTAAPLELATWLLGEITRRCLSFEWSQDDAFKGIAGGGEEENTAREETPCCKWVALLLPA